MESYNENNLIKGIIESMTFVKNQPPKDANKCAGSIRSALEDAVKLFWLKKYEKIPVWIKDDREGFDLFEAISDPRFSECFDEITISYMHMIRIRCNKALHSGTPLTVNEAAELLSILDKCIRSIEQAIPLTFLSPLPSKTPSEETSFTQIKQNKVELQQHGLKKFVTEDMFWGSSYLDMFNDVCGTHFRQYELHGRSWVDLKDLGYSDNGIAWIVFMDGTVHGPSKKYVWVNRISTDGETIEEEYVGADKYHVKKHVAEDALRVSFQRDPSGTEEENLCKFVGVFQFSGCRDTEKGFIRIYQKISNHYPL